MRPGFAFLVSVIAQLVFGTEARARTPAPSSCPTISISCPTDWVPSLPVSISAEVSGGDPRVELKYNWRVSAGEIVGGQGTPSITVDARGLSGQSVTATVEVDGLPTECDRTESCTLATVFEERLPRRFDEYEGVGEAEEDERLSNFGQQLQLEPGAQGYIFYFGPRDTDKRLRRAREFLTSKFGIDPGRITGVNAGRSEKFAVELWVRPTGAEEPRPFRD